MKLVTFEKTDSCRPLTAHLFTDLDMVELVKEYAQQMADCMNSQYVAHNLRGQHRAINKDGKFIRPEDHVYSVMDCLKGMTVGGRAGEPSKEDVEMSKRLFRAILGRVETAEDHTSAVPDALHAMVEFHAGLTAGWDYKFPELEMDSYGVPVMPTVDVFAQYARAYRLYKAAREKATTFR